MTREELFGNLKEIFRDVFDDETIEITESTNSSDIDDWDSINHINLVVAIENEIHLKFSFDDLASLKNVGAMVDLIMVKMES